MKYFAMFGCYIFEAYSFLMRESKGVDPEKKGGEEELGGTEGRGIIMGILL